MAEFCHVAEALLHTAGFSMPNPVTIERRGALIRTIARRWKNGEELIRDADERLAVIELLEWGAMTIEEGVKALWPASLAASDMRTFPLGDAFTEEFFREIVLTGWDHVPDEDLGQLALKGKKIVELGSMADCWIDAGLAADCWIDALTRKAGEFARK
jgi:hypothetical protein